MSETKTSTIKTYTPKDLRQLEGSNLFGLGLYDNRGVEVNFQGTSNSYESHGGLIMPHTHQHDEIIFLISGNYGDFNKKHIVKNTDSVSIIRSGTKHGGHANGFWISIKPKTYQTTGGSWSIRGENIDTLDYKNDYTDQPLTIVSGKDWYAQFINDLQPDFLAMTDVIGGRCPSVTVFDTTKPFDNDQVYGEKFLALKFGEIPAEFYDMHDRK
ncbi:MAG: hypothetical protein V1870_04495 [Candidatus Aenigmatarchaeota archaeon]